MKIALVVYQFIKEKGGVERYVYNLAEQLVSEKYEVHIFTHCLPEKEDNRYIFHYVPAISFWSPLKYWTFAFNAPRAVKKTGIRFDIVHGFTQTLYQDIYRVGGDVTGIICCIRILPCRPSLAGHCSALIQGT